MLDNGYSLVRVEVFNWGNFHGLQKIDLGSVVDLGPLFSPPPAAAILGTNGSGKSTLIDGVMMALLPFENSLKLGVTNDLDSGSAGGRTVRDYVLGKYSSTGDQQTENLGEIYGRKEGCSLFILIFRHNKIPDRYVSMGRIWWYQNYKVQENQLAFISYSPLSIEDLCPSRQTPRNVKTLREHAKKNIPQLVIHETMQAYFMALSSALGNISKDDLKILNRAFYVKSISQIDSFIRENMLLEKESPHLERLLENIRNGKEIAFSIQVCEQKIESILKILKELQGILEFEKTRLELLIQKRLVSIYPSWNDLNSSQQLIKTLEQEISQLKLSRPDLHTSLAQCQRDHQAVQSQLVQDNIEFRIRDLDREIELLSEKTMRLQQLHDQSLRLVQASGLKIPSRNEDWQGFLEKIKKTLEILSLNLVEKNAEIEKHREVKFKLLQQSTSIKEELEHLSRSPTLLPRDLCLLRDEALNDLAIEPNHLKFVGELLQVRADSQQYRRAIESVLFSISRNLLCHPDDLAALTKWINARGLQSDLTVKRIRKSEMAEIMTDTGLDFSCGILPMLDVLPSSKHPFGVYLLRWIAEVFDYKVVEVSDFKNLEGKLVTLEGLVKKDARTLRKLKKNFSFSLGWDNRERIESLAAELSKLNQLFTGEVILIEGFQNEIKSLEAQVDNLKTLASINPEFLGLSGIKLRGTQVKAERTKIERENPNYQKLKEQSIELSEKVNLLMAKLAEKDNLVKMKGDQFDKLVKHIPHQERDLKESPAYQYLVQHHFAEQALMQKLVDLSEQIRKSNRTYLKIDAEIDEKLFVLETRRTQLMTKAAVDLQNYRRTHNDPDLPYDLNNVDFAEFIAEWARILQRLQQTELPQVKEKWKKFFDQVLLDSVKDTINEIKSKIHEIKSSVQSINEVLKLTNFEDLVTEQRYLQIDIQNSTDDRIRKFRRQYEEIEKLLGTTFRLRVESASDEIMQVLLPFVEGLNSDTSNRAFVTDVRNYFQFRVFSLRRMGNSEDVLVEVFTGSRKDAKSSAQTTQLAYTLLASCLAYRFKFHDPILGQDTPRLLVLDEFGGKFDNEKPRDILKLLDKMGFQSILVSPMSKADLLAESICQLVLVHKVSASQSKTQSFPINSRKDYEQLIESRRPRETIVEAGNLDA